jgi:hypothetical protein
MPATPPDGVWIVSRTGGHPSGARLDHWLEQHRNPSHRLVVPKDVKWEVPRQARKI